MTVNGNPLDLTHGAVIREAVLSGRDSADVEVLMG
jgi:hypothetical protein